MLRFRVLLTLFFFVCLSLNNAKAEYEIVLRNDGSAVASMMLTHLSNQAESRFISRQGIGLSTTEFPAQSISMSGIFDGNLSTMQDVSSGLSFLMENVRPQAVSGFSNNVANISMQGGSISLKNGNSTLLSGALAGGNLLALTGSALQEAGANEPLYPINTQKFIYYVATFHVNSGTLSYPLCNSGSIIIRLVNPVSCTVVGKRCLLSSSGLLQFYSSALGEFTANVYDIHISKSDPTCGIPTATPTRTPSRTATRTRTPTATATRTNTPVPSLTPTRTATNTPFIPPTHTPTRTATRTATQTRTVAPSSTTTRTPTRTPTSTSTATPAVTVTPGISSEKPIYPEINCVMLNGDGTVSYYLGYNNLNASPVSIPAGSNTALAKNLFLIDNELSSQQISEFKAGKHKGVFSIQASEKSRLIWVVQYNGQNVEFVTSDSAVPECQPVFPIAECASLNGPNDYTASLGYENRNDFIIRIPIGSYNSISPVPANRGQPEIFQPGRFVNVLNAQFAGMLEWNLGSNKATATSDTPVCQPSLECVDKNIRQLQFETDVATFKLTKIINKLSRTLAKTGSNTARKDAAALRKEAQALHQQSWTAVWSLPEIITNCTNALLCAQVNNSETITGLKNNTNSLLKMVKRTVKSIRIHFGKRSKETKLLAQAKQINQENLELINSIPATATVCN